MAWPKIKNIIILMLLVTNLCLLAFVGWREIRDWQLQDKALEQAIRLTETAFRNVLLPDGEFDAGRFAKHIHSTSSMISGIAMLGSLTGDAGILNRVKTFMEKGYYEIALEFGWCLENDSRPDDLVGEINNTGDFLEACLCLGRAGYEEYFQRADKMIRCHILPAQLIDVSFISNEVKEDDSVSRMAERMKGAFGFPCPYGHEYQPGSEVSFNWDIVGGGVSSLCWAYRNIITWENGILSVNLLFDYENKEISFKNPYSHNGTMEIKLKEKKILRILLPESTDWKSVLEELGKNGVSASRHGSWLYIYNGCYGKNTTVKIEFPKKKRHFCFRKNEFDAVFQGNRIIAMNAQGKRLCFFKEIESGNGGNRND